MSAMLLLAKTIVRRRMPVWFGAAMLISQACAPLRLAGYAVLPDYPISGEPGERHAATLTGPVDAVQLADGRYEIHAASEKDMAYAMGFLQARDRMFQMDLLRHMGNGRLAELVGNVPYGDGTALDADRLNRFLDLSGDARNILASLPPRDRADVEAFAAGVNDWLARGDKSIEHRLLGTEVEAWRPEDSIVVFRLILFGMSHNYSREVRRLLIACDAGIEAVERIWPNNMEFGPTFMPPESLRIEETPLPPAVVPEMRAELPALCPARASAGDVKVEKAQVPFPAAHAAFDALRSLSDGMNASNNWVVSGANTRSGKPILENDPHLPHMAPTLMWAVHQILPFRQEAGFTLPGIPSILFGHNFHVAWGATINNVDVQDLYVEKSAPGGYLYDGAVRAFTSRTETFKIRGADSVSATARYSIHGLIINDVDSFLGSRIPLTALRTISTEGATDALAVRGIAYARNATEFVSAISSLDTACINWVYADTAGNIGYTTPCRVPLRQDWWGTFPVPGWISKYEWKGLVPKSELPQSLNPARGWLATANNQAVPFNRFHTAYNNDPAPPNRYLQIAAFLESASDLTAGAMVPLMFDTGLAAWPGIRKELDDSLCGDGQTEFAGILCRWDGRYAANSTGATLFVLLTGALLDRALADELSGGAQAPLWRYIQGISHFESNVERLWMRPVSDAVWDDSTTAQIENKHDIVRAAYREAIAESVKRFGDASAGWKWGAVRPFYIKHPFGGGGGLLGRMFNGTSYAGQGGPETVFKNQFLRSDRSRFHPIAGPAFRLVVDMANPQAAEFEMAGGESGWPLSPYYENLTADWMAGKPAPLTPEHGARPDNTLRLLPLLGK